MTRRIRRALIWVASVFCVILIAAFIFIATLDWNKAKPYITAAVSNATGRQFSITGDLKVDLGWNSRITASEIQFENASWSKHPKMAEVGSFDAEIDVWQLLTKFRLILPTVTVSKPKVILEKRADGAANWEFRAASAVTPVPEKRTEFPVIQKLTIEDGTVLFDNQETKARLELTLKQAQATGFLQEPVKLTAQGTYQKQPMSLSLEGGSYDNLRSSQEPYPLKIDLAVGKLKATIDGKLIEPLQMKGEDVVLDIQGDNLANLFPLLRLVFPATPPYRLKGHLKHEADLWSFSNFSGRVGDSDLSGNIQVDTEPKRHVMKADLISNLLDFEDLAGFIGGKPGMKDPKTTSNQAKKQAAADTQNDRLFPISPMIWS